MRLTSDGLVVRQYAHIEELKFMDSTASELEQKEFRCQCGKILYITQTSQLQVAYSAARPSQVKPDDAKSEDVVPLDKNIRSLQHNPKQCILFPKLDMDSVSIGVCVYAGPNTNADLPNHLGVSCCWSRRTFDAISCTGRGISVLGTRSPRYQQKRMLSRWI